MRVRSLVFGLATVLLPFAALAEDPSSVQTNCYMDPRRSNTLDTVVIKTDWKAEYPFSERFAASAVAGVDENDPLIDLDVMTFRTTPLVQVDRSGKRTFLPPDLSTFVPELVRQPFVSGDTDLFIVQAPSPQAQVQLRAFLEKGGYEIRESIPRFAYLVSLSRAGLAVLQGRPEVFWIGLYQQAFRFSSKLDYVIVKDPAHELSFTVKLDPAAYPLQDLAEGEIRLFGLTVTLVGRDSQGWIARVAGRALDARRLAALPGVLWVERFVDFQLHNDVARSSSNIVTGRGSVAGPVMDVEAVWARGIRGEGQIASAADTGLDTGNITTVDSMHWDFGRVGNVANPMRVLKGYALGRTGDWSDNQAAPMYGGHGTHTSGSIVGDGVRSGSSPGTNTFTGSHAGVAPKAQFVFQSVMTSTGSLGGLPANLNTLFQSPYNDGARVHSNSWGAAVAGAYDASAQQTDQFAWNNKDMVITFSAGNSGVDGKTISGPNCVNTGAPIDGIIDSGSIGSPGTAKNTITVGAAESYRPSVSYEYPSGTCSNATTWNWFNYCTFSTAPVSSDPMANNASGMAAFSSRGPTSDSRNKPDVVAPGTFILSTRTSVNQTFEQWGTCGVAAGEVAYYVYMGGTSMANPLTAGASTLVRQYYSDGWHANNSAVTNGSAVPAQGFNPSSALVKATLINGAWEMSPGQYGTGTTKEIPAGWDTGHTLPNNVEGYGRVDVEHSLFPGSGWGDVADRVLEVHDVTAGLITGGSNSYTFNVGGNTNPLVVTLVWTDPYASTGAGAKLVNNLDLVVTAPNGTTRYTPNKVDDTAGTADSTNNVEQVKVTSPAAGAWTIRVNGTNVPGNGTAGTNSQPYALVISAVGCTPPGIPSSVNATASGSNQITVSWTAGVPAGSSYRVYRSGGACPGGTFTLVQSGVTGTSFVDTTVQGGLSYSYKVTAVEVTGACESAQSGCASATATGTCTAPPTFAGLTSVTPTPGATCTLTLAWSAATSVCGGTTSYNVYRSTTNGFSPAPSNRVATDIAGTSFVDSSGLTNGTTYYYVVRAVDSSNTVEDANTVQQSGAPAPTLTTMTETFEAASGFDNAGWTHSALSGTVDWVWSTARSQTATHSWLSVGPASPSDRVLVSLAFSVGSSTSLSFWHTYQFQTSGGGSCRDAGTLEISTNGGTTWTVVPDAAFTAGGFTGTAPTGRSNPIGGMRAWCGGTLGTMTQVQVNLASFSGTTAKVRWHEGDDSSNASSGWYVDSVTVTGIPNSCGTAASDVQFFAARATGTAAANGGSVKLEWWTPAGTGANPTVRIRRKTGSYPSGPGDATSNLVGDFSAAGWDAHGSTIDDNAGAGLTNGTTYYYAAYVTTDGANFSSGDLVSSRPQDTTGKIKWVYSTGAASLAAPAREVSVYAVSNDRILHAMVGSDTGGDWPAGWKPMVMNAPAQDRFAVQDVGVGGATRVIFLGSQDGKVYSVDADTGALLKTSNLLTDAGGMIQDAPAGNFKAYDPTAFDLVFVGTRNVSAANKLWALDMANLGGAGGSSFSFDNGGGTTPANAFGIVSSQPSVDYAAKKIYFTTRKRVGGSQQTVWCVDFSSGTSFTTCTGFAPSTSIGDIDSAVIPWAGRLYVGDNNGVVWVLDASTGQTLASFATSDGPVKGFLFPDFFSVPLRLFFSTTTKVWYLTSSGSTLTSLWGPGTPPSGYPIASPSIPLYDGTYLFVGSSDGKLHQLSSLASNPPTDTPLILGAGTATVGSPTQDNVASRVYVGTDGGLVYAVTYPLP